MRRLLKRSWSGGREAAQRASRQPLHHLSRSLLERLEASDVDIEVPNGNTLLLRGVPTHARFFSKPRTNLLLVRVDESTPYFCCLDDDLEYTGQDATVIRAFATAHRRDGWKGLFDANQGQPGLQDALQDALDLLGFEGREPTWALALSGTSFLDSCADDLSQAVDAGHAEQTVARTEEIDEVLAGLCQWRPLACLVLGASGIGKTNLLHGIARRLRQARPDFRMLRIDLPALFAGTGSEAERERILMTVLDDAARASNTVLALESLGSLLADLPHGAALVRHALEKGVPIVATAPIGGADEPDASLADRLRIVKLREPSPTEAHAMVGVWRATIAEHHQVEVDERLVEAVVEHALPLAGHLPGKAIALLDAAVSGAKLAGERVLRLFHIYGAALWFPQIGGGIGGPSRALRSAR